MDMKPTKVKSSLCILTCFVFTLLFLSIGYSQVEEIAKYPSRSITCLSPMQPGAGMDLAGRLICKAAEKYLGQPIMTVNKPGATFTIGTAAIASSKPDGYTIGMPGPPAMFMASQIEKVPFHTLKDFKWIMQFGYFNFGVTVKSDSPFKSLKDVIDYARQNPNKLINGCGGIGGIGHTLMEQVAIKEGVKVTHMPFKGGPDSEKALLGGHINIMTGDVNYSLIEAGEVRLLALLAENRSVDYPQTPILKDLGYDIPAPTILPVAGPKGMPEGIVKKLEEAFTNAIKEPDFINGMRNIRYTIVHRNSKELEDYVSHTYEAYTKLLKEMGLAK
jgi:tripartite-type tricarboxylate transporter receptor subunit TctC